MPSMTLSVPHNLGTEEATRRIVHLIAETKEHFGGMISDVNESWSGSTGTFNFRAMGFAVAGKIQVDASSVTIEIDFPFAALPFKSRVEKEILTQAQSLLA
jgi:hypothetical protein